MSRRTFGATYLAEGRVLVVSGEIDEQARFQLGRVVDEVATVSGAGFTVDLSEVDLLPSSGIAVLIRAGRDHGVRLVAAEGSIAHRVLKICCLEHATVRSA